MLSYFMRTLCSREKRNNRNSQHVIIIVTSLLLSLYRAKINSIVREIVRKHFIIAKQYYCRINIATTFYQRSKNIFKLQQQILLSSSSPAASISNLQRNLISRRAANDKNTTKTTTNLVHIHDKKYFQNMQQRHNKFERHQQEHFLRKQRTFSQKNHSKQQNFTKKFLQQFQYFNNKKNFKIVIISRAFRNIGIDINYIKSSRIIYKIIENLKIILKLIIQINRRIMNILIMLTVAAAAATTTTTTTTTTTNIATTTTEIMNFNKNIVNALIDNETLPSNNIETTTTFQNVEKSEIEISSDKNNIIEFIGNTSGSNSVNNVIDLSTVIEMESLDEILINNNNTLTPAMSQVLLAPTITSAIRSTRTSAASNIVNAAIAGSNNNSSGSNSIGAININGTDDGINSFYFYETEQFAFLWVLFTVIVLGNSAVLVTLFMNKNRKSRMNFFIKQLALADLCVGLLNVLTDIIWRITVSWRAGNLACKVIRFSQVCVTYASTYVLVALSIDRYDAITHPMNFSGSWQRARRLVVSAWTVSALFSSPMLILYEEKLIQGQKQCWIELGESWRWQLYMSLVSMTLFAFPALIISACYAIIVRTIWVKGSVFIPAERAGRNSACLASRRASSRGIIPRAKVKTVKMTFVIVIVFIVCWSPYIIFDLLQVFGQIPRTQTNIAIATFIQSLAPLNSAANPLIYCLFSTQVCRALKRIPPFRWILCNCCCQSQGHNSAPIRCTTVGQRLHNSCDSMRTLTTSLNVSRRSTNNCMRPPRVVIVERPKTILAMSEV